MAPAEEIQTQEQPRAIPDQFASHLPGCTEDRGRTQLREARQLQRFIFRDASVTGIKPSDLALLARAWCALQESIRVLRGIPMPGHLQPVAVPGRRGKIVELARSGFSEAIEAPATKEPKAQ